MNPRPAIPRVNGSTPSVTTARRHSLTSIRSESLIRLTLAPTVAVNSAVTPAEFGGDGWESNPPRTPQQRPANSFEDCGRHQPPYIPGVGLIIRGSLGPAGSPPRPNPSAHAAPAAGSCSSGRSGPGPR